MRTQVPFIGIAAAMAMGVLSTMSNLYPFAMVLVIFLLWVGPIFYLSQEKLNLEYLFILLLFCGLGHSMSKTQASTIKAGLSDHRRTENPNIFILSHSYGGRNFERFRGCHITSKCRVFIYVDPRLSKNFLIGDTVRLNTVSAIPLPSNPKEFNFQKWASRQGVHLQAWVKEKEDFLHSSSTKMSLKRSLHQCEKFIRDRLHDIYATDQSQGLLYGILLGEKSEVLPDTEALFRSTGTLHTMAVSGLHVGIIAMFLTWIMGPWQMPLLKYLKTGVILIFVWLFVFITGGKASAVRAGTMFTLFYLGYNFQKKPSSLNILGLSICLFIASNPMIIYDIGFQLSISAVASILLFFTPISEGLKPLGLPKVFRQAAALNLSVQILVAPISIYYFHQFPSYFLITNMIAIPMATAVVLLGVTALILSLLSLELGAIVGQLIHTIESLGTYLLEAIMRWPYSLSSDLWIGILTLSTLLSGGLIIGIGLQIKEATIIRHGTIVLLISIFNISSELYYRKSPALVAYAGKNRGLVEIYTRDTLYLWGKVSGNETPSFRSYKYQDQQYIKQLTKDNLPLSISTPDFSALLYLNEKELSNDVFIRVGKVDTLSASRSYPLNAISSAISLNYKSPFE